MNTTLQSLKFKVLGFLVTLLPPGAWAHSVDPRFGDFYVGLIHPLSAFQHVLPLLAFGLLAAQQGRAKARLMLSSFVLTFALGALSAVWGLGLPFVGLLNLSSCLILGGLLVAAKTLPVALVGSLSLLFGLSHGYANGMALLDADAAPLVFIPGMIVGVSLLLFYCVAGSDWLMRRLRPDYADAATRMVGGWLAAIAILLIGIDSVLLDRSRLLAAGDTQLTVAATEVGDAEALDILETLLQKIYLAFDAEREEVVYDRLAEAVAGELLGELYLQQRRSLMVQHAGGASIKVSAVDLIDTQVLPRTRVGYVFDAQWTAAGSVDHQGHRHHRTNRYNAMVTVGPVAGVWKITALTLLDEQRIDGREALAAAGR